MGLPTRIPLDHSPAPLLQPALPEFDHEFLAQGLAGEVTLEESDFPGREYWTFTLPGAGRVHAMDAAGIWRPSAKVLVITRQKPGPRNTSRRFIINAFPVPR